MKHVTAWFGSDDFMLFLSNKSDRSILFSENIPYIDDMETKFFSKEFKGLITEDPRGIGNSIENVTEFDGKTLGERRQEGGFSHKAKDYVWSEFVAWYLQKC